MRCPAARCTFRARGKSKSVTAKLCRHWQKEHDDRFVPESIQDLPGVYVCGECSRSFVRLGAHKCKRRKGQMMPREGHLHEFYAMGKAKCRRPLNLGFAMGLGLQ